MIAQYQINGMLLESRINIISDDKDDEEVDLLLAKSRSNVLEARNYVHG